ncbi:MAG: B12-binding domain-containing radical SAM protein [Phototrophicaceae bacterium]
MDVLLGQSYYLRFDPKLWRAMQPYPPLGTLYAAAVLREQGWNVGLFDAMLAESPAAWTTRLDEVRPRYAVIFEDSFNYLSKMSLLRMREAAFAMIAAAKAAGCYVIVSGADMTDHPQLYLQAGAQVVVMGEGEITLAELLRALEANQAIADIHGVAWLNGDQVQKSLPRPPLRDLDTLPRPAWDLADIPSYQALWRERHGYTSLNLITTRGCPFHCNWCAKPIWGQRYAMRSPARVADEMRWIRDQYAPDTLWFMDDIMGINDRWIEQFADELDSRQLRIPFKSLNRADLLLRGETISALARAGADIVWIGAESGSQKILDAMDKGTQVEQIYTATRQLHAHGIKVGFFLQFGYPGETRADIDLTLNMVRELLPDDIGISVSYPLPGTPFYERVRQDLKERQNWQDSEDLAMLYQGPFNTAFYRQLHTVVHKDYRSRKTWQALRQGKLTRADVKRTAAMLYHQLTLPLAQARLNALADIPVR